MQTATENIEQLSRLLNGVEDDHYAVIQYCELLVALSASPDIAGCLEGVNRLVWQIKRHGEKICDAHEIAAGIVSRLANP